MSKTLDRLQAVVEAATPGPWKTDLYYVVGPVPGHRPGGEVIVQCVPTVPGLSWDWKHDGQGRGDHDATFIATARNTYPEALAVVRAAAEHGGGVCSCEALTGGEGPRPIGGGRFYHYQGCDYDEVLASALAAFDEAATRPLP